jgi:phenylalanyl-tRNA synthetase beta chain
LRTRSPRGLHPAAVQWSQVQAAIRALGIDELRSLAPIEVFTPSKQGSAIAPGHYSLLLRVGMQSMERTLTEDELSAWSVKITDALKALGGVQRS